jgi:hypothetical protein
MEQWLNWNRNCETVKHSDIKYVTIGTEIKCHHCAALGGQHRNLKAGKMTFSWKDGNKFCMKVAQISLSDQCPKLYTLFLRKPAKTLVFY